MREREERAREGDLTSESESERRKKMWECISESYLMGLLQAERWRLYRR